MRIVLIVNMNIGVKYLKELIRRKENIVGVVVWPDDPPSELSPDDYCVRKIAFENCLPVFQPRPEDINTPRFIKVLRELKPDLIISASFPKIFSKELLQIPPLGCINTHRSFLPKYRGTHPDVFAIMNGEHEAGVTIHYLDEGIDTGDIIVQGKVEISQTDTGFTLGYEKFSELALDLFREAFPLIKEGRAPRISQNNSEATYVSWRSEYAQIDWYKSALEINNLVRALTYPHLIGGAFTFLAGKKLKVWKTEIVDEKKSYLTIQENKVPGQILAISGQGLLVKTEKGLLLLKEMTFEKDREVSVLEYLKHIFVPIILE
jgi:methionyl-tRNA formyltransferase